MASRFQNQNFLVTGSTSGIGLATARALIAEGATVAIHGLPNRESLSEDVKELINSHSASYIQANLAKAEEASALADRAADQLGKLHGVVFCAAVAFHKPWNQVGADDWDKVMHINLRSNLLIAQSAAKHLEKTKGSMVAVSSTNARRVNKDNLVYDSSKAALNHMFRAIALELRDVGVRVNIVMPGGVDTPMLSNWMKDYAGEDASRQLELARQSGKLGKPEDIAMPILFLLSDDARWITGETLIVDGGAILDS